MPTPQFNVYKHRKQRRDISAFAALIAEPATAEFALPANGRFRVVSTAGSVAGTLACTITGSVQRSIETPELAAGGYVTLDWLERGVGITLEAGFELWVDAGLGRYVKVAELV